MGLAPYGEPKYVDDLIRGQRSSTSSDDGSFRMNMSYLFGYCLDGFTMTQRAIRPSCSTDRPGSPESPI